MFLKANKNMRNFTKNKIISEDRYIYDILNDAEAHFIQITHICPCVFPILFKSILATFCTPWYSYRCQFSALSNINESTRTSMLA